MPVNRGAATVADGDVLLICKLRQRVADPGTKGMAVNPQDFELYVAHYRAEAVNDCLTCGYAGYAAPGGACVNCGDPSGYRTTKAQREGCA